MEQAREVFARSIQLDWIVAGREEPCFIAKLMATLEPFKGGPCPVGINYMTAIARASLQLGDEWRVHPTDELVARLKILLGNGAVEVRYR